MLFQIVINCCVHGEANVFRFRFEQLVVDLRRLVDVFDYIHHQIVRCGFIRGFEDLFQSVSWDATKDGCCKFGFLLNVRNELCWVNGGFPTATEMHLCIECLGMILDRKVLGAIVCGVELG